jgi:hypothetical protein
MLAAAMGSAAPEHSMKSAAILIVLLISSLAVGGCSLDLAQTAAANASTSALLRIEPVRPVPMQEAQLELSLRDPQGKPITGATVKADLMMPDIVMPSNRPAFTEMGNGVYAAKALFTMAGEWELRTQVDHAGGSESFIFTLRTR